MATSFMIGAGASYGSLDCRPYCPPLGKDLFAELIRFNPDVKKYALPYETKFLQDFEQGMKLLYTNSPEYIAHFLRTMAAYFCQFEVGSNNLYVEMFRNAKLNQRRNYISTLNYDLLIEEAVNVCGYRVAYYVSNVPKDNQSLLKLHGSCNFLPPPVLRSGIRDVVVVNTANYPTGLMEYEPHVCTNRKEIVDFAKQANVSIGPAMSIFSERKPMPYAAKFINGQQQQFVESIAKSKRIVIIGIALNPLDNHIWDNLKKFNGTIAYFNPDVSAFKRWVENAHPKRYRAFDVKFEKAVSILKDDLFSRKSYHLRW